jgi:hypothetical protein
MVNMKQNSFQQGVDSVPRGRRGRDRMVVGFTTTYTIGVSYLPKNLVDDINLCLICLTVLNATFSNISAILWRFIFFFGGTGGPPEKHRPRRRFSPLSFTNKIDRHDITEILLKVALNTINQALFRLKVVVYNNTCSSTK